MKIMACTYRHKVGWQVAGQQVAGRQVAGRQVVVVDLVASCWDVEAAEACHIAGSLRTADTADTAAPVSYTHSHMA